MSNLTMEHVSAIMPSAITNGLEKEWPDLLETLRRYEITTKPRIATFLANVAKESGELYYVEELASGWDYEWREDLGNTQEGDGPKFRGHGYIQITGRHNHQVVGEALGVDAEADPLILTRMPYAWYSAGYYWRYMSSWGNLNEYADEGDFESTVLGVRGGEDPDRRHYYDSALGALPDDVTVEGAEEEGYPEIKVAFNEAGWAFDITSGAYIRAQPDMTILTNKNGWLYANVAPPGWAWPEAWDEPDPYSWNYQARHPTRYTWRADVEAIARHLVDNYGVWCNTYYDHPEGYWKTEVSIDVWGPGGRNDPIDPAIGEEIHALLFNDPNEPNINWIIWQAWMWSYYGGWEPFGTDDFSWHYDHIHCTFW